MKKTKIVKLLGLLCAAAVAAALITACRTPPDGQGGLPRATATFAPGTYRVSYGSADDTAWRRGPLVLDVTFSANQIAGITVVEHGDSDYPASGWWFRAYPGVPDQILVRQSTQEIDAFTGATRTRESFIGAVNQAIELAGARPEDLRPQISAEPLPGDRFVPGFHVITVPAGAMDIRGNPATADTPAGQRMLYNNDADMTLRVSFGRNDFFVHEGGGFGVGQGNGGHGESVSANQIAGGTWGGWWFRQVAHMQMNDRQSTRDIDIFTGATRSASALVWGVEQAIAAAGGDPSALAPRAVPPTLMQRQSETASLFVPGHYTVTVNGFGGPMTMTVTLDRTVIRRINVTQHSETDAWWSMAWPAMRDNIYRAQNLDQVDVVAGATVSSRAIINGVREAIRLADPMDR